LYVNQLPGNVGNPDILPENAWNYDLNLRYERQGWMMKSGYFYRNITDFIDWVRDDSDQPYSPLNLGENKVHGLYSQLHRIQDMGSAGRMIFNLGYNYLHPSTSGMELKQSKYILESLKHQLITGLKYDYRKFSVHISNRLIQREL